MVALTQSLPSSYLGLTGQQPRIQVMIVQCDEGSVLKGLLGACEGHLTPTGLSSKGIHWLIYLEYIKVWLDLGLKIGP